MVMKALRAGGMEIDYCPIREKNMKVVLSDGTYIANEEFLEVALGEYNEINFPLQYDGKLITVFHWGIGKLASHKYRIVFMLREYEEINESWNRMKNDLVKIPLTKGQYYQRMSETLKIMHERPDIDYLIFLYEEVVKNPLKHFEILKAKRWPIDPYKASEIVNDELHRVKMEEVAA